MPRPLRIAARLLAGLLLPLLAHAGPLDATRVTLKNGLRVVLAPDSLATTLDVALWLPSGARYERSGQAGVALLAARTAFRNGAERPLAPLEAQGGTGALSVTPDHTSFSATVPPEALATALDFMAARLPGAAVTAGALAAERQALRSEVQRTERTPVARGIARLWAAAWPQHPYASTGAPPNAGSDALTPAALEALRRERWTPGSAVLTLAGAFDPDSALAEVRRRFESRARGNVAPAGAAAAPRAATRAVERLELPVRLCLIGWRGPGLGDADAPALELLAACLGSGPSSALPTALVNDWQLAVTAQAGFSAQREGSLLWTLALVPPGADSAAVERVVLDTAKRMAAQGPAAFEVERARRQLESALDFSLQTSRARGQALGEAELLAGDAAQAARRLNALHTLGAADVQRAAARLFQDAGRATVWMLPAEGSAR